VDEGGLRPSFLVLRGETWDLVERYTDMAGAGARLPERITKGWTASYEID